MSGYFSSFPVSTYGNIICTNLTLRIALLDSVKVESTIYYPHTIPEGERPDSIAFDYYGRCEYDWLIFLANNMIDPYYDWPLSQENFDNYIAYKYGSIVKAQSTIAYYKQLPINWYISNIDNSYANSYNYALMSSSLQGNYSLDVQSNQIQITPASYSYLSPGQQALWQPVYSYDDEFLQNENKKLIRLIDKQYLSVFESNLQTLMNQ